MKHPTFQFPKTSPTAVLFNSRQHVQSMCVLVVPSDSCHAYVSCWFYPSYRTTTEGKDLCRVVSIDKMYTYTYIFETTATSFVFFHRRDLARDSTMSMLLHNIRLLKWYYRRHGSACSSCSCYKNFWYCTSELSYATEQYGILRVRRTCAIVYSEFLESGTSSTPTSKLQQRRLLQLRLSQNVYKYSKHHAGDWSAVKPLGPGWEGRLWYLATGMSMRHETCVLGARSVEKRRSAY